MKTCNAHTTINSERIRNTRTARQWHSARVCLCGYTHVARQCAHENEQTRSAWRQARTRALEHIILMPPCRPVRCCCSGAGINILAEPIIEQRITRTWALRWAGRSEVRCELQIATRPDVGATNASRTDCECTAIIMRRVCVCVCLLFRQRITNPFRSIFTLQDRQALFVSSCNNSGQSYLPSGFGFS